MVWDQRVAGSIPACPISVMNKCECGKEISLSATHCKECHHKHRRQDYINEWLKTGETGSKVGRSPQGYIRDYILEEQNYKCSICKIDQEWNGKPLKFILDHIDGNCTNNRRENLRLICHNCDSQLDTYKSKNKKSKRIHRKKYYDKHRLRLNLEGQADR